MVPLFRLLGRAGYELLSSSHRHTAAPIPGTSCSSCATSPSDANSAEWYSMRLLSVTGSGSSDARFALATSSSETRMKHVSGPKRRLACDRKQTQGVTYVPGLICHPCSWSDGEVRPSRVFDGDRVRIRDSSSIFHSRQLAFCCITQHDVFHQEFTCFHI
jgi:hypothetical protein